MRLEFYLTRREFLGGLLGGGALLAMGCAADPFPFQPMGTAFRRVWVHADAHIGLGGRDNDGRGGAEWLELSVRDVKDNLVPVDYVLALGDVTHAGKADELARYDGIRRSAGLGPWYELVGNHDYAAVPAGLWRRYVRRKTRYALIDGNAVWVFLSAEQGRSVGRVAYASVQWLQRTIAAHQDKNVIVCTHQAVRNTVAGSEGGETFLEHRVLFQRLLEQVRVDLWLCGHIHGGRRNARYVVRQGRTTFINVASVGHAYGTGACNSYVLEMTGGSRTMQARCRDHDRATWMADQSLQVEFPYPWRLADRGRLVLLEEPAEVYA